MLREHEWCSAYYIDKVFHLSTNGGGEDTAPTTQAAKRLLRSQGTPHLLRKSKTSCAYNIAKALTL